MNMESGKFFLHVVEKIFSRGLVLNAVIEAFQIVAERLSVFFTNVTDTLCDGDQCLGK